MKRKKFLSLMILVVVINITLSINNENEIADLLFLKIEALANDEEESSGELGPLQSYGCAIEENVIVGHDDNGNPIFQHVSYSGELGRCMGYSGRCSSYSCTKLAQ